MTEKVVIPIDVIRYNDAHLWIFKLPEENRSGDIKATIDNWLHSEDADKQLINFHVGQTFIVTKEISLQIESIETRDHAPITPST